MLGSFDSYTPVSYTHLAWKGKETFILFEERKAIVGACKYVDKVVDSCREDSDAWDLWHYDKPVSYTHLDVYKRQLLSLPVIRCWTKRFQI